MSARSSTAGCGDRVGHQVSHWRPVTTQTPRPRSPAAKPHSKVRQEARVLVLCLWSAIPVPAIPPGITFRQVLGQCLDVVSRVLPGAVGIKVGPHGLHLLLQGIARPILCSLEPDIKSTNQEPLESPGPPSSEAKVSAEPAIFSKEHGDRGLTACANQALNRLELPEATERRQPGARKEGHCHSKCFLKSSLPHPLLTVMVR